MLVVMLAAACSPQPEGCVPLGDAIQLDDALREASGIALSRAQRDVLWTHNDSEAGAAVFAIDTAGRLLARVELTGAHNRDWEDIAVAACPNGGPAGDCIFIADIGDNRATREGVGLWIAPEPPPEDGTSVQAVFLRAHYPDGPRDAEAAAILDDGSLLVVSKGRESAVSIYRSEPLLWPAPDAEPVQMGLLQRLGAEPAELPDQVTGAAVNGDGIVAIRSYSRLQFYRFDTDTLRPVLDDPVALDSLGEPQGEGVAMGPRGRVYLVSEAGPQAVAPRLTPLRCRLP